MVNELLLGQDGCGMLWLLLCLLLFLPEYYYFCNYCYCYYSY